VADEASHWLQHVFDVPRLLIPLFARIESSEMPDCI
jgi:hypothetical protein